ncbi:MULTISPECIES: murein transglycosylase A [unclassified Bradyrhizobium]|uniref:murein transglycosylase A n=1 Tax=unclassified Bradyrhizobium TaxID=2631580 RepID=UPI0028ED3F2C|nr:MULTISPECIES: MltA domain-containing protein [unclassified Bradyrhizobium]
MVREIWKRGFAAHRVKYWTSALALSVVAVALAPYAAEAVRSRHRIPAASVRHLPYPQLDWPLEINNSQYLPLAWNDVPGWNDDDQLAAYRTFRASCKPIAAKTDVTPDAKALGDSLRDPCRDARAADLADNAAARAFFERHFEPLKISKLGDADGFVTGYYEPVIDGSRTQNEVYNVPVYRRPSNLFVRGFKQDATSLPNKGPVYRKIGRRKLVPYYDRAEIEDGAIEGRGLEIAWLRNQTDLLFAQIQGSARISLDDGSTIRINYDAYNGHPYTPVGRVLIERGIIPREQMSMQRIRDWMEQNPEGANELRRTNRSYIFFREVQLSEKDEAVGAQGIPLTPGRSIAVDKSLHVYGTPFFITGELPIESEKSKTAFHRLMIAQDTGSAIVGPARADLYFGAGQDAGKVSGRLKHSIQFVMLVPKSLDPVARGRKMPLPDARPSEKIAKLFPQVLPKQAAKEAAKDQAKEQDQATTAAAPSAAKDSKAAAPVAASSAIAVAKSATTVAQNVVAPQPVPLPEARPRLESDRNIRRLRYGRRHRNRR